MAGFQFAAQDFPDSAARQLIAEFDVTRDLVAGQVLAAVGDEGGGIQ